MENALTIAAGAAKSFDDDMNGERDNSGIIDWLAISYESQLPPSWKQALAA